MCEAAREQQFISKAYDLATHAGDVVESAPPGKKAERFIKKHKSEFKKRYGKRGTEVLYATAWKKFGETMNFRNYLSLVEDIRQ